MSDQEIVKAGLLLTLHNILISILSLKSLLPILTYAVYFGVTSLDWFAYSEMKTQIGVLTLR